MNESSLEEVQKRVFSGTVPIRIELDTLDIPLCFNVPRNISFGVFLYSKLKAEIGETCENFCLLVNKTDPIQPHIPAGVIYDAYFTQKSGFHPLSILINTQNRNPTLKHILQCSTEQIAQKYFCHLFKECLFLTSGNLSLLQQHTNLHLRILESCIKQNYDDYLALREIIEEIGNTRQFWPVKVYKKGDKIVQCFLKVDTDAKQTLLDALQTKSIIDEKAIIQGIEINTNTPIKDLISALSYPDGFLYVTLK